MLSRLLCLILGHVFETPPRILLAFRYGDCSRCRRYITERMD